MNRTLDQAKDKPELLQPYVVQDQLKQLAKDQKTPELLQTDFAELVLEGCQEVAVHPPNIALALRPSIGVWEYVKICVDDLSVVALSIPEYLAFKEQLVGKPV